VADLITRTKRELQERIDRLEAAVEELPKLRAALAALEDGGSAGDGGRGRGRGRAGGSGGSGTSGRGRRSGQRRPRGANRDAILGVVGERPGVSVGEVANVVAKEGVKKNVVYTTVNKLVKDGLIAKQDGALTVVNPNTGN
jgi:hypothetical protein